MATPVDPPVQVLVDVVHELTGADRVEAAVAGTEPSVRVLAVSGHRPGEEPPTVLEVVDDDGTLAELRVWGAAPDRLHDVLPDAAALLAVAAGRARRGGQERVWVGRLGHDLKTPLTAVLGFAGLLGGGGVVPASPELVAAAGRVTEAGERLLTDLEADLTRWRQPRPSDLSS